MTTLTDSATGLREPALRGQTVIVIGGSSGIGLETARSARAEGAQVVLTGRDPERLGRAAADVGAQQHAAFDVHDPDRLDAFFRSLPAPVDHVMVTAGSPYYAPLPDMDIADAGRRFAEALELFAMAASFGATDSLVLPPQLLVARDLNAEQQRLAGVGESTVRLSIGLESIEDLLADLQQALAKA